MVAERPDGPVAAAVAALPLVDHHVHGAGRTPLDRAAFEDGLTESRWPAPPGTTQLDSQVGFAVRRWCAPLLDLEAFADPNAYLQRRAELGPDDVNRRLLRASGIRHFLVETGYRAEEILDPAGMATVSGARADEIVRLESVAEEVARAGVDAAGFSAAFDRRLEQRAARAVGLKSIVAYRYGLDFDPTRPGPDEVHRAAGRWFGRIERGGDARVDDPVLLRHLIWAAVDSGLPLQFHVGYGDPDIELQRCDPLHLTGFLHAIRERRVPVLLLHCYPYHRNAGYLAQTFPDVYLDVGLAVNYTGARSTAVVAECLELAPFGKLLFSSDAWGPAELHYLGARLWRRAYATVAQGFVDDGDWSLTDALRVAELVGARNAIRVYRLADFP